MLEFKAPEIYDMAWVKEAMTASNEMACEYCFGNLYIWCKVYKNTIANYNGLFLAKDGLEKACYIYPCGKGDKKPAVEELIKYSQANDDGPLEMYCLTPQSVDELNKMFPDKFEIVEDRAYFDYIYNSQDLINLAGRKYHSKRNHISYFKNNYDWKYERISRENLPECYEMNRKWEQLRSNKNGEALEEELDAIRRGFIKYEELGFVGGLLRKDGEVVAYTFGEEINPDVFCVHVEKAYPDVRGAYPMINQQFCANELSGYRYINREDDVGDEGLRKAKLSYYPEILLKKYKAIYKG